MDYIFNSDKSMVKAGSSKLQGAGKKVRQVWGDDGGGQCLVGISSMRAMGSGGCATAHLNNNDVISSPPPTHCNLF